MSNVYTTIIGVPKTARNKRIYGEGGSFSNSVVNNISNASIVIPTDIIEFTNLATPIIIDYNTLWAPTHGQFPRVELIIDNGDGTRYRSMQQMLFTTLTSGGGLDDLIDTISWDLGVGMEASGWIILN